MLEYLTSQAIVPLPERCFYQTQVNRLRLFKGEMYKQNVVNDQWERSAAADYCHGYPSANDRVALGRDVRGVLCVLARDGQEYRYSYSRWILSTTPQPWYRYLTP